MRFQDKPVLVTGAGALICWLASVGASFVTGQVWTIDGGRMSKLGLP